MKRTLEVTDIFVEQKFAGLETHLFFSEGLVTKEGNFYEIKIVSNNVKIGDEITYETKVVGEGKSIYCEKVDKEEEMNTAHFKAVNHFKEVYFKQVKD